MAAAQTRPLPVTEQEVYVFLSSHFDALRACEIETLSWQIAPSATVRFEASGGYEETLTGAQFIEEVRRSCRPYVTYNWDSVDTTVSVWETRASARSELTWGDRQPEGSGRSSVSIEQRSELVRQGDGLVLTEIEERWRELAPGGIEAFRERHGRGSLFGGAVRWYRGAIEMVRDLWKRGAVRRGADAPE